MVDSNSPIVSDEKIKKINDDSSLPKNFFDDVVLLPDFYQPENYELEMATHNSIRKMLFFQTIQQIKKIEFFHLRKETDSFKFQEVINSKQSFLDRIVDIFKEKLYEKKLVGVKILKYERNSRIKQYKAKYYHDLRKECYYCIIYPSSFFDKILNTFYRAFSKND